MAITVRQDALERARTDGFLEARFTFDDDPRLRPDQDAVSPWQNECEANGRHVVLVGELPEALHFVMVIFRDSPPDLGYVLAQFVEVFRRRLGCDPAVDVEEGAEVWTSPKTTHSTAVAVARDLATIDGQERDENLETVFRIMAS